ncbi:MAG: hypothetical protein Gaeavirus7_15 [Gaeavirus sp.]|uniref:FNIP repeat-containing protein n=1 Tax=Gaeavirus sp. TaxID=2487767 RepID=A0A3G4ZYS3_9VIRU|nr:MAG: hypothetical protein Gaeavirus7_15 [Gaeavirus sp.]
MQPNIELYYNEDSTELHLPGYFNESLDNTTFPSTLKSISFGLEFNRPLHNIKFPPNLESIKLGAFYNKSLSNIKFPPSLKHLDIGYSYQQILDNLPNTITILKLGPALTDIINLPSSLYQIIIRGEHLINSIINKIPQTCTIIIDNHNFI